MPQGEGAAGPPPRCFDIGLVLAGAVSAGAYTAGVVDFLIQALEAWEAAKTAERDRRGDDRRKWTVPPHDARLRVMSGASAGAITAAIAAVALSEEFAPVTGLSPTGPARANKLYRSWVEQADIRSMLSPADLAAGRPLSSLLNTMPLDSIARAAIRFDWRGRWRPYVADRLPVFLTVTNLRGVPYGIGLEGVTPVEHRMSAHGDHMSFMLVNPEAAPPATEAAPGTVLNPDRPTDPAWERLARAALASSAFPVGLSPRLLSRKAADYNRRPWVVPRAGREPVDGRCVCSEEVTIAPSWPLADDDDYAFLSVDGGTVNNEPLELARRALAGPAGRNPRDPTEAERAVIMIDPFPNAVAFEPDYAAEDDLVSVAKEVLAGLLAQARFKADELKLAQDPEVFSRFIIAPTRYTEGGGGDTPERFALASGGMGGFGGFLSVDFRAHDFQLGRRNCQRFLQRHFVLSARNPLFADWSRALKSDDRFRIDRDGKHFLPVIPLVGEAAKPIPQPRWPQLPAADMKILRGLVHDRARAVGGRFIDRYGGGWLMRTVLKTGWWTFGRRRVVTKIVEWIEGDLARRGLYVAAPPETDSDLETPYADS